MKLGQKDRAWRALQEAVKCNYDNWKVWDNLMAVSTDCADFEEVRIQLYMYCSELHVRISCLCAVVTDDVKSIWYSNAKNSGDM